MSIEDREKQKAYNKLYYDANKEKFRADAKAYREANKEKLRLANKARYEANKEERKAGAKIYAVNNVKARRIYEKAYRKANSKRTKVYMLRRLYGLSFDDYNNMLTIQNNSCVICKTEESKLPRKLSVDHDHNSGKIRGLLCAYCNRALGLFNDEPSRILKAIEYLGGFTTDCFYVNAHRFANFSTKNTVFEKQAIVVNQSNKCGICKIGFGPKAENREPHFDHDHTTGQIRGALCVKCNVGLGRCKDNPVILQNMIEYLRKNDPALDGTSNANEETISV